VAQIPNKKSYFLLFTGDFSELEEFHFLSAPSQPETFASLLRNSKFIQEQAFNSITTQLINNAT
jgi:hypothetical protein